MVCTFFFNSKKPIMYQNRIYDTLLDTNNFYVSMNTYFSLRNYVNKEGKSLIYLYITSKNERERISVDLLVKPNDWDTKKKKVKSNIENAHDYNLILSNLEAKITAIKTVYRLSETILTPAKLRKELLEGMVRVDFNAFIKQSLIDERNQIKAGTHRRYTVVHNKLKEYKKNIFFSEINLQWFKSFRKHLADKGNQTTTINSNIKVVKKWLKQAQESGIKILVNIDEVESGKTTGNKISLNPEELKKISSYYYSDFINPCHKATLGYFLFSCFTGLRLSDVMALRRSDIGKEVEFKSVKTSKDQIISLNKKSIEIIKSNPDLFIQFLHPNYMNKKLKEIMCFLGIKKTISFHCGRHTFATNFLRMGGKVEKLQVLLGHSKIETTMIYVHILSSEANEEIFLLDNLF